MGYYSNKAEAKQQQAKNKRVFRGAKKSGKMLVQEWPDLMQLIEVVTVAGDGISISRTSDLGAICITILNGAPPYDKFYASSIEEAEATNEAIMSGYTDLERSVGGN